jgi:HD-like signal output (HDOD) protein/signal transduction histidine kinase
MNRVTGKSVGAIDIRKLPSLPHVLLHLIQVCHKPDTTIEELSDIVLKDAALTAKVVAIISSPTYARHGTIGDFRQILAELGLETIKNITTSAAVNQLFSRHSGETDDYLASYWCSSYRCACLAKALAQVTGYPEEEEAYIAGLLHDIGQLMLQKKSGGEYARLLSQTEATDNRATMEAGLFGITTAESGAALIKNWDLPSFMSDAVLYQEEPANAILDTPRLVKLVNLANKLTDADGKISAELAQEAEQLFSLSEETLGKVLAMTEEQLQETAATLAVPLETAVGQNTDSETTSNLSIKEVRHQLALQVRDIAILDGARQHLEHGGELQGILRIIQKNIFILFGLSNSLFFLYDPETNALKGTSCRDHQRERVGELCVPLMPDRSLAVEAVLQKTVIHSLDHKWMESLPVVDSQVTKLLKSEGILCVPLLADKAIIGTLVAGINSSELAVLKKKFGQLMMFATEAAGVIQRRQLQAKERQTLLETERSRLESRTREMVHEANNPLGIINNYLDILGINLEEEHPAKEQLGIIKEEIKRVSDILMQLREIPEPEDTHGGLIDLNAFISELGEIFKASLFSSHNIELELQLDDSMEPFHGNRNSLKQVLTNLMKNAAEAINNGGAVYIETRDQVNVNGRNYVEITISDNGPGIPEQVMANLFRPVVSSKGGEHLGIGLTIVKDLITEMHGSISCRSSGNRGTEFRILIPR